MCGNQVRTRDPEVENDISWPLHYRNVNLAHSKHSPTARVAWGFRRRESSNETEWGRADRE